MFKDQLTPPSPPTWRAGICRCIPLGGVFRNIPSQAFSPQYSMPTVDNFSAWIEVEGKQLPEYGVQTSVNGDQLIRTCWIPSEAGKVRFFI